MNSMKNIIRIAFLSMTLVLALTINVEAQQSSRKKKKTNFAEHLWFGGGLGLGISGNTFNFGLSPMVGYKFTNNFSAGVRIPLDYTYAKLSSSNGTTAVYNNLDYGAGAFTRYKIFRGIFAHAEYNYLWIKEPVASGNTLLLDPENPNRLLKQSRNLDEFNVGLGYSSGGRVGTEISILYNVLDEATSTTIPLVDSSGVEL